MFDQNTTFIKLTDHSTDVGIAPGYQNFSVSHEENPHYTSFYSDIELHVTTDSDCSWNVTVKEVG